MGLTSMTGFARSEGRAGDSSFAWEARSVNGRGLDVRLRLAPGFEGLEPQVREMVAKTIARGSVALTLTLAELSGVARLRLNAPAFEAVLNAVSEIQKRTTCDRPRPEGLLALKGVLEFAESAPAELGAAGTALRAGVINGLESVLDGLDQARKAEGARLGAVLGDQLSEVSRLVKTISASPARRPEAIRARLKEQIGRILDTGSAFDESRLAQEAVLIATRADVEEELKRLEAHVSAARELLDQAQPAGRKLDFLAQEFNREANTLCSKSNDIEMTRAGLALKAVIDQLREQVQNIE